MCASRAELPAIRPTRAPLRPLVAVARLTLALGAVGIVLALLAPTSFAHTMLVKDINPGSGGSFPSDLTSFGGRLYFSANDGTHGYELWSSDGSAAGTTLVSDINPGSNGSLPYDLTVADAHGTDVLYFAATDGTRGDELWAYGGSTKLVKDINPGSGDSSPDYLTTASDTLYFAADDGTHGEQLWTSDGTSSSTTPVSDLSVNPSNLTDAGGTLYFTAYYPADGYELWTSDGTTARLVDDINPGSASSLPSHLTNVGGTLYFTADDGAHGPELWKSNGTAATTTLVKDIKPGGEGSDPSDLVNVNGTLYFSANYGLGYDLWKSDGTSAATTSIGDEEYGASPLSWITYAGGTVFFVANGELWKSDGTFAGTTVVKDINPGSARSDPSELVNVNGRLYFTANDGAHGTELWTSDGTAAGTTLVSDINPGTGNSDPAYLTSVNGTLYFDADDGTHGGELWSFRPTLTISRNGGGSGIVASSQSGINCGSTCSHDYGVGDTVTLRAIPGSGSTFTGWSGGGCSGTGTCTVTMSSDQAVAATFATNPTSQQTPLVSLTRLKISPRKALSDGRQLKHQCVKRTKDNDRNERCRLPIKLQITYTLNIPATVRITLKREAPGRKVSGECVKRTNKNRKRTQCTRRVQLHGSLNQADKAGTISFSWNARIGARNLASGTYVLIAIPSANGYKGTPRQTTFKILG